MAAEMLVTKLLGVIITDDLKWQGPTDYVWRGEASSRLYLLMMLS